MGKTNTATSSTSIARAKCTDWAQIEATGKTVEVDRMRVIPLVDSRARAFLVVVTLDNTAGRLAPGMSLSAWVPTGKTADRLTVDKDAVLRNETGTAYVYVARRQGPQSSSTPAVATPVNVKELFSVGRRIVVESHNLQDGDLVVVEGNERLFPGMPILGHPRERDAKTTESGAPR